MKLELEQGAAVWDGSTWNFTPNTPTAAQLRDYEKQAIGTGCKPEAIRSLYQHIMEAERPDEFILIGDNCTLTWSIATKQATLHLGVARKDRGVKNPPCKQRVNITQHTGRVECSDELNSLAKEALRVWQVQGSPTPLRWVLKASSALRAPLSGEVMADVLASGAA